MIAPALTQFHLPSILRSLTGSHPVQVVWTKAEITARGRG